MALGEAALAGSGEGRAPLLGRLDPAASGRYALGDEVIDVHEQPPGAEGAATRANFLRLERSG